MATTPPPKPIEETKTETEEKKIRNAKEEDCTKLIHPPIAKIAINAMETRTTTASSLALVALRLNKPGSAAKRT